MQVRPATLHDVPKIAKIAVESTIGTPWHAARYPSGSPPLEEYTESKAQRVARAILDPRFRVYVVCDEHARHRATWQADLKSQQIGKDDLVPDFSPVVGFLVIERHGFGDLTPVDLPPTPTDPPGLDKECVERWEAKQAEWIAMLEKKGPFLRGDQFYVAPHARKLGAANKLCKALADEAKDKDLPFYTEATYFITPFYERFAAENGYKIKYHGNYQLKSKLSLCIYFLEFVKADPREEKRVVAPSDRRYRLGSDEL